MHSFTRGSASPGGDAPLGVDMSILNFYCALITQAMDFVLAHISRSRDRNINDGSSKPGIKT